MAIGSPRNPIITLQSQKDGHGLKCNMNKMRNKSVEKS